MSFRWSNGLIKRFKEAARADEARRRVAESTVRGRHLGCTVVYSGTGRVLSIDLDESRFTDHSGSTDCAGVSAAVKGAVLDAQQKMCSVRQAEWARVNRRLLTKYSGSPEMLGPYPWDHVNYHSDKVLLDFPQALSGAEVQFGMSLEESLQRREVVRAGMERVWRTGAAQIDAKSREIHEQMKRRPPA
eukprot:TRINITY_DN30567_c0_g1_i1.p1 TRINITY_DN30567_c0_g1~~TRINITY_DN30567_c0_g1_i1.p1  ORF type:complete len:206 (+),score=72.45 TRINITY_DN30567_c0_g1_i1:57-620(+)